MGKVKVYEKLVQTIVKLVNNEIFLIFEEDDKLKEELEAFVPNFKEFFQEYDQYYGDDWEVTYHIESAQQLEKSDESITVCVVQINVKWMMSLFNTNLNELEIIP